MKTKSERALLYSASSVIILTIGIKVIAFVKQAILAGYFGADQSLDLYLLSADTLGDFSAALFSALSMATLTFYVSTKEKKGRELALVFIRKIFLLFVPISFVLVLVFAIYSNEIAGLLATNYGLAQQKAVGRYISYLCPTIVFLCVTYIFVAVLDAEKKFWPGKMIGFTLSVSIILATVLFGGQYGTQALIFAYVLAYFIHMIVVSVQTKKYLHGIIIAKGKISIIPFLLMTVPIVLGNAAVEINALVDKLLATDVGSGGLSTLTYGATLNSFVVSILITAPTGVLLSYIATSIAQNREDKAKNYIYNSMVGLTAILLPISIISLIWADGIVSIIYQRGAFDAAAVQRTAETLRGYAIGFPLIGIREVLIKIHLAYKDSKTVMVNSVIAIGGNIILSIVLCRIFGLFGISCGTSIAAAIAMLLCMNSVHKHMVGLINTGLLVDFGKLMISTVLIGIVSAIIYKANIIGNTLLDFLFMLIISGILYVIILFLFKSSAFSIGRSIIYRIKNSN